MLLQNLGALMKLIKSIFYVLIITNLLGCSMKAVELVHAENEDLTKTCRNAFIEWHAASHMVDYYNYKCAQRAIKQGYLLKDESLASKDFSIPDSPSGQHWNQALALKELDVGRLTQEKFDNIKKEASQGFYGNPTT